MTLLRAFFVFLLLSGGPEIEKSYSGSDMRSIIPSEIFGLSEKAQGYAVPDESWFYGKLSESSLAGAKAQSILVVFGTTEVVPCYKTHTQ